MRKSLFFSSFLFLLIGLSPFLLSAASTSTPPGQPTDVSAVAGSEQATIFFTEPAETGGSPIGAYRVISTPEAHKATGTSSPIIINNLKNGSLYSFVVVAINENGSGEFSTSSNSVIPQATPPSSPTAVKAVAWDKQAIVYFKAPVSTGGFPVHTYTVTAEPGGLKAYGDSPVTIEGLENGTAYTFTVTATNQIGESVPSAASTPVTPYAKNEKYVRDLFTGLGIAGDPFSLSVAEKEKLQDLSTELNSTSTNVVFNGLAFANVETVESAGVFYLKPTSGSISEEKYLKLLARETIDPDDFIEKNNNPIERAVYKMFYNALVAGQSIDSMQADMESYLNQQKDSGTILNYEYNPIDGNLVIYYPGEFSDFGFRLNPLSYAQMMDSAIKAGANPEQYSSERLDSYEREFALGNILIVNTLAETPLEITFNRENILKSLSVILNDDLSKEEKISTIAWPTTEAGEQPEASAVAPAGKFSQFIPFVYASALPSISEINALVDETGTIVPPNKTIYLFEGPDNLGGSSVSFVNYYSYYNSLSAFKDNGYIVTSVNWGILGETSIEKLAALMENDAASNIIIDAHGGELQAGIQAEILYVGPTLTSENSQKITERLASLENEYGDGAVFLQYQNYNDEVFVAFMVTPSFFNHFISHKKSLVILSSCFGGHFANSFNARVFMSSPANSFSYAHVTHNDLAKMMPYLSKKQDPGAIPFSPEKARSFAGIENFHQQLIIENSQTPPAEKAQLAQARLDCNAKLDTLCGLIVTTSNAETIAVSPSVKYVNNGGTDQIEFNVPMDTSSVSVDQIVTVDTSQCGMQGGVSGQWINSTSGGVHNLPSVIKLNGLGTVYRNWHNSDFTEAGIPKVPYVTFVVHSALATSLFSKIPLNGNTDACTTSGSGGGTTVNCISQDVWKEPETLKYNGNHPNTDFVYALPCKPPVSCSGSQTNEGGELATWTAYGGLPNSSYSWSGDPEGQTGNPVVGVGTSTCYKTATVTITSEGDVSTATCDLITPDLKPDMPASVTISPSINSCIPSDGDIVVSWDKAEGASLYNYYFYCDSRMIFSGLTSTTTATINEPDLSAAGSCYVEVVPISPCGIRNEPGAISGSVTINTPPVISPANNISTNSCTSLNLTVTGTSADSCGGNLTYSASSLPTGATFDEASGSFNWTPTTDQIGTTSVNFSVSDGFGATDATSSVITVQPNLNIPTDFNVNAGSPINISLASADCDSLAGVTSKKSFLQTVASSVNLAVKNMFAAVVKLALKATNENIFTYRAEPLPPGATLDEKTGEFKWTPTDSQLGTTTITFTVKHKATGISTSKTVNIFAISPIPVVTGFITPANSLSLTIDIYEFTASDNVGVTGYLVTENVSVPDKDLPSWSVIPQTKYTFATPGLKTLYAWVKDGDGNISAPATASLDVGLEWETEYHVGMDWYTATSFCANKETAGGFKPGLAWHLPTAAALQTAYYLNNVGFYDTYFWTNESISATRANVVQMGTGLANHSVGYKSYSQYTRCVR